MNEAKRQTCNGCHYLYKKDYLELELCLHKDTDRLYTHKNSVCCTIKKSQIGKS